MESFGIFKDLALIIIFAKFFGLAAKKCKAPQVVGEIFAGLIIGPSILGLVAQTDFLSRMAEIGVVLIMFLAGLETNLKKLLKVGPKAFLIACAGVFIPLVGGTLLYMGFYGVTPVGDEAFIKALFIGIIMTATSVSITVQTLREMGYLKGQIGTTIMGAAIIDDVLGIIVMTYVIGIKNPKSNPFTVIGSTVAFFLFALVIGYVIFRIFVFIESKYPHNRRIPIFGLALCFSLAYIAEKYFGIADITGAYLAGIILCSTYNSEYIAEKMNVNAYMLFGPIFFASIGLKTNIGNLDLSILLFAVGFVFVALLTKVIGCSFMALLCKFKRSEALAIGVGMMTRGEVALIVAQKGLAVGVFTSKYMTAVILLIIISSIITPVLLKIIFTRFVKTAD